MMNVSSAFKFLNLRETASQAEANASYRRLLKEYHPDRNTHRSEWSHTMTVRLTEAYDAVSSYISSIRAEDAEAQDSQAQDARQESREAETEPDSGYSITMQVRIGNLYDQLLHHVHDYYTGGMNNVHLRQEGTMRHRFRALLRRLANTVEDLRLTMEWPGSSLQHSQVHAIHDFAAAFYENMLIKPRQPETLTRDEAKSQTLYRNGSLSMDNAIRKGILELEQKNGLITPGSRHQAEQSFMLLLSSYSRSIFVADTLIKLYLLKAFSALCEFLEEQF